MALKKVRKIAAFAMGIGILLFLISSLIESESFLAVCSIVGFILIIGGLIFLLIFWKCPCCYRGLPFDGFLRIKYCPHCGYDLEL